MTVRRQLIAAVALTTLGVGVLGFAGWWVVGAPALTAVELALAVAVWRRHPS